MDAYLAGRRLRRALAPLGVLAGLALPATCAGCGRLATPWCPACAREFDLACAAPCIVAGAAGSACGPGGAVLAAGAYEGVVRAAIVAFKDGGRRDLVPVLAPPVRAVLLAAAAARLTPGEPLVVVPAPSSARSRRERGDVPLHLVAREALSGLDVLAARECVWAPVLRHTRRVADQAGLSRERRARNLDGAVTVARPDAVRGRPVVVVDDVLTTGATARECVRALRAAGADPVAVVAIAATPGRR